MRRLLILSLLIIGISFSLFAENETSIKEIKVSGTIDTVTVFSDRAQVQRKTSIELDAGKTYLLFKNLPTAVMKNSLQVRGTGKASIHDAVIIDEYLKKNTSQQLLELYGQKESLEQEIIRLDDGLIIVNKQLSFLDKIVERLTSTSDTEGEVNPQNWIQMVDFYSQRISQLSKNRRETLQEKKDAQKELQKINQEISKLGNPSTEKITVAKILLNAEKKTTINLEMSYMVYGPSWKPFYDLKLNSQSKKLELHYQAYVKQSTGEDWTNVKLNLSTAQASVSGSHPELSAWYINLRQPHQSVSRPSRARKAMADFASLDESAGAMPEAEKESAEEDFIREEQAAVKSGATAMTFLCKGQFNIKSNNQEHRSMIMIQEYKADLLYSAVPKLSPHAYLKAKMTNTSDFALLPGKSNVFLDGAFTANSHLDLIAPGNDFEVFLGIDESVAIEYKLINKKYSENGLVKKQKRIDYSYQIIVENTKNDAINLIIKDHLPIPQDEDIKVILLKPENTDQNKSINLDNQSIISWELELGAKEKKITDFSFYVEYPEDKNITGL